MVLGLSLSVKLKQYTIVYKEFDTGGVKTFHNSTINKVPRARKGKLPWYCWEFQRFLKQCKVLTLPLVSLNHVSVRSFY